MRIGVIFPANDVGTDPGAIRAVAQAAEDLGFVHLLTFDHVVGRAGDPSDYAGRQWHEPLVLLSHLAAVTSRIELATGIVILPQRQTALLAKQATEVDMLSGGRLRLGVGVGWNPQEYAALGKDFTRRGRRMDDQLPLLAELWTATTITGEIPGERFEGVGLNPPPARRIPLWIGGTGPQAVRRAVAHGDGVILTMVDHATVGDLRDRLLAAAMAAGRSVTTLGIEVMANGEDGDLDTLHRSMPLWAADGVTHLSLFLARERRATPDELMARMRRLAELI